MADHPAIEIHIPPSTDPGIHDRLYLLLDDFEPSAIDEDDAGGRWRVFFRTSAHRDAAAAALTGVEGVRAALLEVPDEDWARRSQQDLRAIEAGSLVIAPPWDVPKGSMPVIIIEPATGFGTGHHATTRLCLRLMQQLELRGARVLDMGTGSGVLALAAWKLGAADVVAIDSDPDALDNARLNIKQNGADASIDIIRDDLSGLRIERAAVVLANLTGAVLVRYTDELRSLVAEGGYLILSGFAAEDAPVVRVAFADFDVIAEEKEADWGALTLRRGA